MNAPDTIYPISLATAARLTRNKPSTLAGIARRIHVGRTEGCTRLLEKDELEAILREKQPKSGRPKSSLR